MVSRYYNSSHFLRLLYVCQTMTSNPFPTLDIFYTEVWNDRSWWNELRRVPIHPINLCSTRWTCAQRARTTPATRTSALTTPLWWFTTARSCADTWIKPRWAPALKRPSSTTSWETTGRRLELTPSLDWPGSALRSSLTTGFLSASAMSLLGRVRVVLLCLYYLLSHGIYLKSSFRIHWMMRQDV